MDTAETATRITQMGRSLERIATAPGIDTVATATGWWYLTGAPGADVNIVMMTGDDPEFLDRALARIDHLDCPAYVELIGDALALRDRLDTTWTGVGTMPVMAVDLTAVTPSRNHRVRRASVGDHDTVVGLISRAFDLAPSLVMVMTDVLLREGESAGFWLLEADGEPRSAVVVLPVEESASVWCMATPAEHKRKGYGKALLGTALAAAVDDGATIGLLGATAEGLPLYTSMGWTTIAEAHLFAADRSGRSAR